MVHTPSQVCRFLGGRSTLSQSIGKRTSIKEVRNGLILVLRLLHLCRSVDLCQILRTISRQGSRIFILMKKKGSGLEWEELLSLRGAACCCPTTLILHYVTLTSHCALPGTPLFRSLSPPYPPLTAKALGSITKCLLTAFGVPTQVYGPHSTRGAAVKMFKKLGMTSDQVAQLGKWKNLEAFSKHYLRVGAVGVAAEKLTGFVHRGVSQGNCAEPEWSRTPCSDQGTGGSDHKGGAQEHCEPTRPPKGIRRGKTGVRGPTGSQDGGTLRAEHEGKMGPVFARRLLFVCFSCRGCFLTV